MTISSTYKPLYPTTFEDVKMNVPKEVNVEFSFVVKAPKQYVMDAWHLPKDKGGAIVPCTAGETNGDKAWPGITDSMERIIYVGGIAVTQVVGNLQTPENGDWHFEWKAGLPYFKMPFPLSMIMSSVHGTATLADGPGPNETTVTVKNYQQPGLALWFTKFAAKNATPTIPAAAPERFAKKQFLGPQHINF